MSEHTQKNGKQTSLVSQESICSKYQIRTFIYIRLIIITILLLKSLLPALPISAPIGLSLFRRSQSQKPPINTDKVDIVIQPRLDQSDYHLTMVKRHLSKI